MPTLRPSAEDAPALRVFGDHAPRIAALLRVRPSLAPRLLFAPTRAVHALGAALHLDDQMTLMEDEELARHLEVTEPRAHCGDGHPRFPDPHVAGAVPPRGIAGHDHRTDRGNGRPLRPHRRGAGRTAAIRASAGHRQPGSLGAVVSWPGGARGSRGARRLPGVRQGPRGAVAATRAHHHPLPPPVS